MVPAEANLTAAANAYDERTVTLAGFTSASGVTVTAEFRLNVEESGAALLTLTNGSGFTVTSDGANLVINWVVTEAQMDALRAALKAAGMSVAQWSLKVTPANLRTQQWFYGTFNPFPVATK